MTDAQDKPQEPTCHREDVWIGYPDWMCGTHQTSWPCTQKKRDKKDAELLAARIRAEARRG